MMLNKKEIRKEMIKQASNLPQEYCEKADKEILHQVMKVEELKTSQMIFCFVSMEHEINTKAIITELLKKGKDVCVPKSLKLGIMEAYQIASLEDLELGKYDILEPKAHCKKIEAREIDFGLIPCVTADTDGYRLGYGGGFYDRYLANSAMTKVLICRQRLIIDQVPREEHDIPVDYLITEEIQKKF